MNDDHSDEETSEIDGLLKDLFSEDEVHLDADGDVELSEEEEERLRILFEEDVEEDEEEEYFEEEI